VTRLVLERLRQYKLYLRHGKCEFAKTKIEYLGLIISTDKRRWIREIAGVAEWPTRTTRKRFNPSWASPISTALHPRVSDLARRCSTLHGRTPHGGGEVERSAFEAFGLA